MKIATQPGEIDYRKSEVFAFAVNAGTYEDPVNYFYIKIKERRFFVWSICFVQLMFRWIYITNMFPKFRVIDFEYIVKIWRG